MTHSQWTLKEQINVEKWPKLCVIIGNKKEGNTKIETSESCNIKKWHGFWFLKLNFYNNFTGTVSKNKCFGLHFKQVFWQWINV